MMLDTGFPMLDAENQNIKIEYPESIINVYLLTYQAYITTMTIADPFGND
jgi:hypothetical protein